MKCVSACASCLALALISAALIRPGEARSRLDETVAEVKSSEPAAKLLGGVIPPLDLSAAITPGRFAEKSRAHSEPHGHEACASGCALSHHPTPSLAREHCRALLVEYQRTAVGQQSGALDALLYFGSQTRFRLRDDSLRSLLSADHLTLLEHELSRDRAVVSLRVIDQHGQIRAMCPPTAVPQHIRQVFKCDVENLQPLVCSGTVKRVGKDHIWQRL